MKTLSTTLGVFCGCTAVRWYLHRSSRRDTFLAGERIRLCLLKRCPCFPAECWV